MKKIHKYLAITGLLVVAIFMGRYYQEIYAHSWRFFHTDDVVVGHKEFRIPSGPYIWRKGTASNAAPEHAPFFPIEVWANK